MRKINTTVEKALRERTFGDLAIKRIGRNCYLIVTISGASHILTNGHGQQMTFRHAWQIREWLQKGFQIAADSIPIESCG